MAHKTWQEIVKKAKAYLALDQADHYLDRDDGSFPWEFVTSCEPGGGHRMEIDTSVRFRAVHPSGLTFSWYFEIEPHEANGKGHYIIDLEGCQETLKHLKGKGRKAFSEYLKTCAHKVAAKADEWKKITEEQYKTADDLMKASQI